MWKEDPDFLKITTKGYEQNQEFYLKHINCVIAMPTTFKWKRWKAREGQS